MWCQKANKHQWHWPLRGYDKTESSRHIWNLIVCLFYWWSDSLWAISNSAKLIVWGLKLFVQLIGVISVAFQLQVPWQILWLNFVLLLPLKFVCVYMNKRKLLNLRKFTSGYVNHPIGRKRHKCSCFSLSSFGWFTDFHVNFVTDFVTVRGSHFAELLKNFLFESYHKLVWIWVSPTIYWPSGLHGAACDGPLGPIAVLDEVLDYGPVRLRTMIINFVN